MTCTCTYNNSKFWTQSSKSLLTYGEWYALIPLKSLTPCPWEMFLCLSTCLVSNYVINSIKGFLSRILTLKWHWHPHHKFFWLGILFGPLLELKSSSVIFPTCISFSETFVSMCILIFARFTNFEDVQLNKKYFLFHTKKII